MNPVREMKITSLANWFGSNRSGGEMVGRQLGRLRWCGIPCVGGAGEIPHIDTTAGLANDLHSHIINLARVVRHNDQRGRLIELLESRLFHPVELAQAQQRCIEREAEGATGGLFGDGSAPVLLRENGDVDWAADYFVASWMGRGGEAGKVREFNQNLAIRFTSSGGASSTRFRSAVESLEAWGAALKFWEFSAFDALEFLDRVKDEPYHGLYIDLPWPDLGDEYKHKVSSAYHGRIAAKVATFRNVRIVIRYGAHHLIERLYSAPQWTWLRHSSTNQRGNDCEEVLIINGPAHGAAAK